jgi:Tfp pilus assembly protein PilW
VGVAVTSANRNPAGFSILELLVAMALTGLVVTSIVMVFDWQDRHWLDREDEAEARLTLQGVKTHLSRLLRSTGGALPSPFGGIVMHPKYGDSIDLVINRTGEEATTTAIAYNGPSSKNYLYLPVDSTTGFSTTGYAALQVEIARNANNCSPAGILSVGSWKDSLVILPIDSIIASPPQIRLNMVAFMASSGLANDNCAKSVAVTSAQTVYSLDTIRFAKVGDTLYQDVSRQGWFPLAGRIDTISFSYLQPGGSWSTDSVATNTTLEIDAVRVWFTIVPEAAAGRAASAIQQYASSVDISLRNASRLSNTRLP